MERPWAERQLCRWWLIGVFTDDRDSRLRPAARGTDGLILIDLDDCERGQSASTCAVIPVAPQSNTRGYTTVANSWSPSDLFLEGNQWNEAGTSLYWKTRPSHAEKKTSAERAVFPTDSCRMKRAWGTKRAILQRNMALGILNRSARYWKP